MASNWFLYDQELADVKAGNKGASLRATTWGKGKGQAGNEGDGNKGEGKKGEGKKGDGKKGDGKKGDGKKGDGKKGDGKKGIDAKGVQHGPRTPDQTLSIVITALNREIAAIVQARDMLEELSDEL